MFKVASCPSDVLSYTNRAIVNSRDINTEQIRHVEVTNQARKRSVFTIQADDKAQPGCMCFSLPMRKWAELSLNETVEVRPYTFDHSSQYVTAITLEVDFMQKVASSSEIYDSDVMAKEFTRQFPNQAFTKNQTIGFKFGDRKLLALTVKEMQIAPVDLLKGDSNAEVQPLSTHVGCVSPNAIVTFITKKESLLKLSGRSKGMSSVPALINPNWDFENLGVGGLDKEFNAIFRRCFSSRVFPVDFIEQMGLKHVRGILLYGPPGTGKTLLARQIGKMLNAREPKIVNGPQILDKYVGESEANIRKLFEDAEAEFRTAGNNSGLHIIIFDEIDAICKARGSVAGSSSVHDTVVNQLLSKIDGVESLNNILVIGMTNRRDMIDEALLRPGRFEVQIEIGLPDEKGRLQIFQIHTALMRKYKKLADDVDLNELAALTKNFSGAEIEGLIRAAQSCAMNRLVKPSKEIKVKPSDLDKLMVCRADFIYALENDVKPAFGSSTESLSRLISAGIIHWGSDVKYILDEGDLMISETRDPASSGIISLLLEGAPNTGKTALAAAIALKSEFPFIKLCSSQTMIGYTEMAKCLAIKKIFDDAHKSPLSVIVVDNVERLLDYVPIGPRFSNHVLQALLDLLCEEPPKGRKLFVIVTSSERSMLEQFGLYSRFSKVCHVPTLSRGEHVISVFDALETGTQGVGTGRGFTREEHMRIAKAIQGKRLQIGIRMLFNLINEARQVDPCLRVIKFLDDLEEIGSLEMGSQTLGY